MTYKSTRQRSAFEEAEQVLWDASQTARMHRAGVIYINSIMLLNG